MSQSGGVESLGGVWGGQSRGMELRPCVWGLGLLTLWLLLGVCKLGWPNTHTLKGDRTQMQNPELKPTTETDKRKQKQKSHATPV